MVARTARFISGRLLHHLVDLHAAGPIGGDGLEKLFKSTGFTGSALNLPDAPAESICANRTADYFVSSGMDIASILEMWILVRRETFDHARSRSEPAIQRTTHE
jgi:hypothetical protein